MSGAFPNLPKCNSLKISSLQPTRVSVTQSLKRQARASGSQKFGLKLGFPSMTRDQAAPIIAFSEAQLGQAETFTYVPPLEGGSRGSCSTVVSVDGSHARGVSDISLVGADAPLELGDFIKFENHSKIYRVLVAGQHSIKVNPPLQQNVSDADLVTYRDVPFTVAFSKDVQEYAVAPGRLYSYSCELIEVF